MSGELLRPSEVARRFRVHMVTVRGWEDAGLLPRSIRTPGGHRRYRAADIPELPPEDDELLTAPEVATLLGVSLMTVHRRADAGELPTAPTPGDHRRFRSSVVWALLSGDAGEAE